MSLYSNELKDCIVENISEDEFLQLLTLEKQAQESGGKEFERLFAMSRRILSLEAQGKEIKKTKIVGDTLFVRDWDTLRLVRVWLLSLWSADTQEEYTKSIDALFEYADMKELIALYSALPILSYQEYWKKRCMEGIRGNIGSVHQSIMEDNIYPSKYLDEIEWNHLVLKAFFTGRNVLRIKGLFEKLNTSLSQSVADYILERDSAKRPIHPVLWILIADSADKRHVNILNNEFKDEKDLFKINCLKYSIKNNDIFRQSIDEKYQKELLTIPEIEELVTLYS